MCTAILQRLVVRDKKNVKTSPAACVSTRQNKWLLHRYAIVSSDDQSIAGGREVHGAATSVTSCAVFVASASVVVTIG